MEQDNENNQAVNSSWVIYPKYNSDLEDVKIAANEVLHRDGEKEALKVFRSKMYIIEHNQNQYLREIYAIFLSTFPEEKEMLNTTIGVCIRRSDQTLEYLLNSKTFDSESIKRMYLFSIFEILVIIIDGAAFPYGTTPRDAPELDVTGISTLGC